MKKLYERIRDFLFFALVGVYWGFIGGLIASMAAFTMRYCPFWCLGFTAFFVLFHLSDFLKFYREKNWLAFSGRLISLFAITAFLVSIFALAFGGFSTVDVFDAFGFIFLMILSIVAVTFWILLKQYGSQTWLYKELEKIVDGLYVLGVFWKN